MNHVSWTSVVLTSIFLGNVHLLQESNNPVLASERYFARNFYQRVALDSGGGNLVVSPLSIYVLLVTLLEGATGQTRSQLLHTLGLDDNIGPHLKGFIKQAQIFQDKESSIQIMTEMFLDKDFIVNSDFVSVASKYYHVDVETVDLSKKDSAAKIINHKVMEGTNHTIRSVVTEDDLVRDSMVCVSVVHVRDSWKLPFPGGRTTQEKFTLSSKSDMLVNMMHMVEQLPFVWDGTLQAKILSLDLERKDCSLVLILPDSKDGLSDLEANLASMDYIPLLRLLNSTSPVRVQVSLPRFRVEGAFNMEHTLQEMGLGVFSANADLSGISCCGGLHVSTVRQKTYIVVEESGIEASSATVMSLSNSVEEIPIQEFRADHPFLFLLLVGEQVLLQGRVVQPEDGTIKQT